MDKNKQLCELLGIQWYDLAGPGVYDNPDFTTDAGKVELLRLIRKQKDWYYFVKQMDIGLVRRNPIGERFTLLNTEYILDTTGLLLKAAVEWMEGRK
jgi:hypothetical protein